MPERYTITIAAEPAGPDKFGRPPDVRLRQLLKMLLRVFGFRCERIEPAAGREANAKA